MSSKGQSQRTGAPQVTGGQALLFHYALRYREKGDRFSVEGMAAAFPFTAYLFEGTEIEALCGDLVRRGLLKHVPPKAWKVAESATQDLRGVEDEAMVYARSIAPRVLRRIPLEVFRELDRVKSEDPVLSGFAADSTLGRSGWWGYITRFSTAYSETLSGDLALSAFARQIYEDAGVEEEVIGQPDVGDDRWREEGVAFLGGKIPEITPWKSLSAIVYFSNAASFDGAARQKLDGARDKRMTKNPGCVHVLIPLGEPPTAARGLLGGRTGFAFVWPNDLRDIAVTSRSAEKFRSIVKPQVDIRLISPYQLSGPVREGFFYGRQEEIDLVFAHPNTNYAFYGNRRIGKTSLLLRIEDLLKAQGTGVAYVDCEALSSEEDFCHALCSAMGVTAVATIGRLISEVRRSGRHLVLLLDEVDWSANPATLDLVLRGLRALANSGQVRLLIAGFRGLHALYRDPISGMHNLADPLQLGGLSERAALDLATRPMTALGVQYEDAEAMPKRVVDLSGSHPNVIQHMCQCLIELLSYQRRSSVADDDISAVFEGAGFRQYVDGLFVQSLTRVEKIVVFANPLRMSFSEYIALENVKRACPSIPQARVLEALSNLEVAYILSKKGKSYSYCYDHFPTILQHNHDIGQLLADLSAQEKDDPSGASPRGTEGSV